MWGRSYIDLCFNEYFLKNFEYIQKIKYIETDTDSVNSSKSEIMEH